MKKVFLLLFLTWILVMLAAPFAPSKAQAVSQIPTQLIQIPMCKPTYAELVTYLTKWDVQHKQQLVDGRFWGLTYHELNLVLLSDQAKGEDAKYVVLHEFIHVCFKEKGIRVPYDVEEFMVDIQARQLYTELFGEKK